jgi:hypothetical protein
MAKRKSQLEHDNIVESLVGHLKSNKHINIKADLANHIRPSTIKWKNAKTGHIPDVTSKKDGQAYIFEVETFDSINDQHTEDQWKLFAASARANSKRFILVIPNGSDKKANQRTKELGIEVDEIWAMR